MSTWRPGYRSPRSWGQGKCVFGEPTSAHPVLKVHKPDSRCWRAMVSIWEPRMSTWWIEGETNWFDYIYRDGRKRLQEDEEGARGTQGGGREVNGKAEQADNRGWSSTPQEIEMQRKKSRQVSLGMAGNDPTAQDVAQAGPWKKERRRKRKSPSAHASISMRSDFESQHKVESGNCGPSVTDSYYELCTAFWCFGNAYGFDAVWELK